MRRNKSVAALALALLFQFVSAPLCLAQQAPDSGAVPTPQAPTPINLDLTSTDRTLTSALAAKSPVNILVDGAQRQIDGSTLLTPAERLAVYQVVSTGNQQINLGASGQAVGGSFNMGTNFSNYVSGMVIPNGVTATRDAGVAGALNLAGNLTNAGNIFAYSTNSAVNNATFNAANITNQTTGTISTVLPSTLAGTLPTNIVSNLNLNLSAINNIVNSGIISSAGNLNATAGGTITNALPAGVTATAPVMSAINNVNLQSAIGNIINSGVITAATGNLNIQSLTNSLNINNITGQLQALNGNINIGDASSLAKITTNILGGDASAKTFNLFSGDGIASLNMNRILGCVNVEAGEAHLTVHDNNVLTIGSMKLTGDPTIFNGAGSIFINGPLQFAGEDLAIIAGGHVIAENDTFINTSGASRGGNVTIVAGADLRDYATLNSARRPSGAEDPPGGIYSHYHPENREYWSLQNPQATLSVWGPSATGGSINLSGMTSIDTSSQGTAGNVTLVAFGGGIVGPSQITTVGAIQSGDVKALAPLGIELGDVNTGSSASAQGNIRLSATTPSTQAFFTERIQQGGTTFFTRYWTDQVIFKDGAKQPQFFPGGAVGYGDFTSYHRDATGNAVFHASTPGAISTGALTAGGFILLQTLSDITTGNLTTAGGTATTNSGVTIDGRNINTGSLSIGPGTDVAVVGRGDNTLEVGSGSQGIGHISLPSSGKDIEISIFNSNGVNLGQDLSGPTVKHLGLDAGNGDLGINGHTARAAGGQIQAFAEGAVKLGAGGKISADALNGDGGHVGLVANAIDGSGTISANATGNGYGGDVDIIGENSESLSVTGGGGISIQANGAGWGGGGNVYLDGPALLISNSNHVGVSADGGDTGSGGMITVDSTFTSFPSTVNVANQNGAMSLHADGGSQSGDGGQVYVNADYDVTVNSNAISASVRGTEGSGGQIGVFAANSGAGNITLVGDLHADAKGTGNGGGVYLSASRLELQSDRTTHISANGSGDGDGGVISIQTYDPDQDLTVGSTSGGLSLKATGGSQGSLIGGGGDIAVEAAGNLAINAADISVDSFAENANGGKLTLVAGYVSDSFSCCPFARQIIVVPEKKLLLGGNLSTNGAGLGDGGEIWIKAGSLDLTSPTSITANGGSSGNGGSIKLEAISHFQSGDYLAQSNGSSAGNGGTINIYAPTFSIGTAQVSLQANALGTGNGGTITFESSGDDWSEPGSTLLLSADTAGATSGSKGGAVTLTVAKNLTLNASSSISASSKGTQGDGGDINIIAGHTAAGVLKTNGVIRADGGSESGKGGSINLKQNSEQEMILDGIISASAVQGVSGEISITNDANSAFLVNVLGTIAADSQVQSATTTFGKPGSVQDLTVTVGDKLRYHVEETNHDGKIKGSIKAYGDYVTFNSKQVNVHLDFLQVRALHDFKIELEMPGTQASFSKPNSAVLADGQIYIKAQTIVNNGTVGSNAEAQGGGRIELHAVNLIQWFPNHDELFDPADLEPLLPGVQASASHGTTAGGTLSLKNNGVFQAPGTNGLIQIDGFKAVDFSGSGSLVAGKRILVQTVTDGDSGLVQFKSGSQTFQTGLGSAETGEVIFQSPRFEVAENAQLHVTANNPNQLFISGKIPADRFVGLSQSRTPTPAETFPISLNVINDGVVEGSYIEFASSAKINVAGTGSILSTHLKFDSASTLTVEQKKLTGAVTAKALAGLRVETQQDGLNLAEAYSFFGDVAVSTRLGNLSVTGPVGTGNGSILIQDYDLTGNIAVNNSIVAKRMMLTSGRSLVDRASIAIVVGSLPEILHPIPEDNVPTGFVQYHELGTGHNTVYGTNFVIDSKAQAPPSVQQTLVDVLGGDQSVPRIVVVDEGSKQDNHSHISFGSDALLLRSQQNVVDPDDAYEGLDFSNPTLVSQLQQDQQVGLLGGNLTTGPSGVSGSVAFTPFNLASHLAALNVPKSVQVSLIGFQSEDSLTIEANSMIQGTVSFNSPTPSAGSLYFSSGKTVEVGGALVSDGDLSIKATTIKNDGVVQSAKQLNVSGASPLNLDGMGTYRSVASSITIQNDGPVIINGNLSLRTPAARSEILATQVAFAGVVTSDNLTVKTLSGPISQSNGELRAGFLTLQSADSIGSAAQAIRTTVPNITLDAAGSIWLSSSVAIFPVVFNSITGGGSDTGISADSDTTIVSAILDGNFTMEVAGFALLQRMQLSQGNSVSVKSEGFKVSEFLKAPGGNIQISADHFHAESGAEISAADIAIKPWTAASIGIGNGQMIGEDFLTSLNAPYVYLGGWQLSGGITVLSDIDFSTSGIQNLYAITTGDYSASETMTRLSPLVNYTILASNINSGAISGGTSIVLQSAGRISIDNLITRPGGSIQLIGNHIVVAPDASITSSAVVLKPYSDVAISVGDGPSNVIASSALVSLTANYVYVGGWDRSGNMTLVNNVDLSNAHIGNLYAITTGDYGATNTQLTLNSTTNFNVYANQIKTGSIMGGASATLNATHTLTIDGTVASGNVAAVGDYIAGVQGATVTGSSVIFKPYHDIPVTIGSDNGSNINSSLLASTTALYAYIGGWDRSQTLSLAGDLDLSRGSINNAYLITTGNYSATGRNVFLSSSSNYNVYAHDVATGTVNSGASVAFNATGNLLVDGTVSQPGGYTALTGNKLSIAPNASINTSTAVLKNAADTHLSIGDSSSTLDKQLLSQTSAQYLYLGGWDRSQGVTVRGDIDLSASTIANLYVINTGTYDGSDSHWSTATNANFNVYGAHIQTGSVTGGAAAVFNASGDINVTRLISAGYVGLVGNNITRETSGGIVGETVVIKPYSDIQMNVGTGTASNIQSSVLTSVNANYAYLGGWDRSAGISLNSNLDISANNIQNFYFITTGDFNSEGKSLSLHSGSNMSIYAHDVSVGDITGGASASLNAGSALGLNGSINLPNGYVALTGNTLSSNNSTITASTVVIKPTSDVLISIGSGSGFVVSNSLLSGTTASYAYVGGWDRSAGIVANGSVDISSAGIQNLYAITTGDYKANGAQMFLPAASNYSVYARNIATGAVTSGASLSLNATDSCIVSGSLNIAGGYIGITSNSLSNNSNSVINAATVVLKPYSDIAINVGQGGGYVLTAALLNSVNSQYLYVGGWDRSAGITVNGTVDLSAKSAGNIYMITQGNYTATSSVSRYNNENNLNVYAQKIWTGNSSGLNAAVYHSVQDLHVDGNVGAETVIFDGHPVVYEPIAYYTAGISVSNAIRRDATIYGDVWASVDCIASHDSHGKIKLRKGDFLIHCDKAAQVITRNASIVVRKGTVALVSANGDNWSVQVLVGAPNGACHITSGKHHFDLGVGQDLRSVGQQDLAKTSVARRRVQTITDGDRNFETGEFSFSSLATNSGLLKTLHHSPARKDQALAKAMLKSAACMSVVTSAHGAYR